MAVTIRLMRLGKRNMPFYRIVAVDKKKKRNGKYLEAVGTYNPVSNPAQVEIDKDKLKAWIQKGAQISEGMRKLLKTQKMG